MHLQPLLVLKIHKELLESKENVIENVLCLKVKTLFSYFLFTFFPTKQGDGNFSIVPFVFPVFQTNPYVKASFGMKHSNGQIRI